LKYCFVRIPLEYEDQLKDLIDEIKEIAKEMGCKRIRSRKVVTWFEPKREYRFYFDTEEQIEKFLDRISPMYHRAMNDLGGKSWRVKPGDTVILNDP